MLRKRNSIAPFFVALLTLLLLSAFANAQNGKGWDGKVQGKQVVTQVDFKFDRTADFDNFAAGKLPVNIILKNPGSGQTITLASRLLTQGLKPSVDKSLVTIYVVIDNLTAPIWNEKGCIDTQTSAENTAGGDGVNITLTYAACGGSAGAQNRPGAPLKGVDVKIGRNEGAPLHGIDIKLGSNAAGKQGTIKIVTPSRSDVTESSAEYFKLKINPSSNGVTCCNIVILNSGKGAGSPKNAGF